VLKNQHAFLSYNHVLVWKLICSIISFLFLLSSLKGVQQQQQQGARQVNPSAGRPPRPAAVPLPDEGPQNKQQKTKIPVLEKHLINQLSSDEQNSINSKFQEATEADKKVTIVYLFLCNFYDVH
jgi:hypothetical protein